MVNVIFQKNFHKSSCWITKGEVPEVTPPLKQTSMNIITGLEKGKGHSWPFPNHFHFYS